jgi:hypothetical protein
MNLTPREKKKAAPKIMQLAAQLSPTVWFSVLTTHAWMLTYMNGASLPKANKCPERKIKLGCPENVIACPEM